MRLLLIRHGESIFNAEGRIQGQQDVPLSPRGEQQAAALAAALADQPIDAVFASPLRRAADTARPLAEALQRTLVFDARLKEIHAGIFQGLLWSEIRERYPDESRQWQAHEPQFVIPEGESRAALAERGRAALEDIRQQPHACVAVVAHGGLLTAALKLLLEIPPRRTPFQLWNASISRVEWGDELQLVSLNETEHLRQIPALTSRGRSDLVV